jgi:hypothetical protein
MSRYYENTEGELFVDPIVKNHAGLTKITEAEFNAKLVERKKPTTEQLLQQLTQARKEQETQGVTINGIRYAGDPGNRQALQEAIAFMEDAGLTEFPKWKCSDDEFHVNHPLADVFDAYQAIGERRAALIAIEGEYAEKITEGTLTDLGEVVWP